MRWSRRIILHSTGVPTIWSVSTGAWVATALAIVRGRAGLVHQPAEERAGKSIAFVRALAALRIFRLRSGTHAFGMPLHSHDPFRPAGPFHGLDHSIGRANGDAQLTPGP